MHDADRWEAYANGIVRDKRVSLYCLPPAENPLQKCGTMREFLTTRQKHLQLNILYGSRAVRLRADACAPVREY